MTSIEKGVMQLRIADTLSADPDPIPTLTEEAATMDTIEDFGHADNADHHLQPERQLTVILKKLDSPKAGDTHPLPERYAVTVQQIDKLPGQERMVKETTTITDEKAADIVDWLRKEVLDL